MAGLERENEMFSYLFQPLEVLLEDEDIMLFIGLRSWKGIKKRLLILFFTIFLHVFELKGIKKLADSFLYKFLAFL